MQEIKKGDQNDHLFPLKIKIVFLTLFIHTYSLNKKNEETFVTKQFYFHNTDSFPRYLRTLRPLLIKVSLYYL